jgi:hypothetical protein
MRIVGDTARPTICCVACQKSVSRHLKRRAGMAQGMQLKTFSLSARYAPDRHCATATCTAPAPPSAAKKKSILVVHGGAHD